MADDREALFEPGALARRRDRAMARGFLEGADFLWRAAAEEIAARLHEITRDFGALAVIGTGAGVVARAVSGRAGTARLEQRDASPRMAAAAGAGVLGDEVLGLDEGAFDLALSVLQLHWSDDPVGHLIQLRRALKPDGLMIAACFGGETLRELRAALAEAEAEVAGGLSPRIAPMGDIRSLGALLQRAGYALPVADAVSLDVDYGSAWALMRDLRAMGESNILAARLRHPTRAAVMRRADEIYAERFGRADGRVPARFEIVFLTGWAPGPAQPQPLRPGSATARLADALGTRERPAGEKPGR